LKISRFVRAILISFSLHLAVKALVLKRKFRTILPSAFALLYFVACNQPAVRTPLKTMRNLRQPANYLDLPDTGVQTGGVNMITNDGKVQSLDKAVWKATSRCCYCHGDRHDHEYMECFESFFLKGN
jgi:hypothetical protein